jgi:raffinose/stachyose/melibiose transport system substrate-binding protein
MKKTIKILSLLMALILTLTMFAGCKANDDEGSVDEEQEKTLTMTVGIPVDSSDDDWSDWESVLATWIKDFDMFYHIDLKFTKVPTEGEALKNFIKKVENGKVACFFTSRQEFLEKMIEDESIISLETLQSRYTAVMEETPEGIYSISEEPSLENYMYPIFGTFQGLYYNRTLFKELELQNPNSWENVLAAVEAFKAKGITPIAAGFADEGLEYMIDEMVLSEGGTAEHSYQPAFGVVSSWERAVNSIKALENAGAFTPDCYNVSFEEAVESFLNGTAAMIVAPSNAFGGELPADDVKVVGFPATPTGKREAGSIVARINHGIYFGRNNFNKKETRYAEAVVDLLGSDYFGSADFYELYADESTFCVDPAYYSDFGDSHYDDALKSLVTNMEAADWTMRERLLTMDTTVDSFRKALTGTDVATALQAAADAEIAAAAALEEEKKD